MDDNTHQQQMDDLRRELDIQRQREVQNLENSFANERNNLNAQLQQKQNEINQISISFEAEKNNLNNQLQQKQNEINNQQTVFNNERNNLNAQIQQKQNELDQVRNDLTLQIQQRDRNIQEQSNAINFKDNELQDQRNNIIQIQNERSSLETEKIAKNSEISELRGKVEILEKNNQDLERQNQEKNESIIEKLSDHYDNYVESATISQSFWFKMVITSFLILVGLTLFSYFKLSATNVPTDVQLNITVDGQKVSAINETTVSNSGNKINWQDYIVPLVRSIMLEGLAICFLWFCMNRFSYFTKLITEYKNRSIVSKSYLGVIYNTKDEQIKNEATKIVADTLFARCSVEMGSELPLKEAVKVVSDMTSR